MEKIDRVIKSFVLKRGLTKPMMAGLVCQTAEGLGQGDFKALAFKDGVLFIKAKDHLLAHRLNLKTKALVRAINKKLAYEAVKNIRISG